MQESARRSLTAPARRRTGVGGALGETTLRFRFCGLYRETAEPARGYVQAPDAEAAYQLLSDKGIVTESLEGDPEPAAAAQPATSSKPPHAVTHPAPRSTPRPTPRAAPKAPAHATPITRFSETLEDALESALDSSSSAVPFDDLTQRYRGKTVRVIDREKIRQRVAEVVDSTLSASETNRESGATARERVADALSGLFSDPRNISTEHRPAAATAPAAPDVNIADQIGRLSGVVEQAEGLIAAMQAALRNAGTGAAPRRQVSTSTIPSPDAEQNQVLREIFQSNLDLRRAMASQLNS
jgi:hypothetical protein